MEKMTGTVKMNENNVAIDIDSLDTVIGGTFDLDHFPKWAYEEAGFKVVYHFFARNEYIKDVRMAKPIIMTKPTPLWQHRDMKLSKK